jgi:ribosome-associated translation inhibitor RaiA
MKISLSYRGIATHNGVERLFTHYCGKMEKFLTAYEPDLVQCHGAMEFSRKKNHYGLSLNLTLPTATLHSLASAKDVTSTVQGAFTELESQLKKHVGRLRHDHEWKRKRGRLRTELSRA